MHCCLCGRDLDNNIYKKCTKCSGRGSAKCQLICTTCYAKRGTCNDCFGLENIGRLSTAVLGSTSTPPSSVNHSVLPTPLTATTAPSLVSDQQQQSNSGTASSGEGSTPEEEVDVQRSDHQQTAQSAVTAPSLETDQQQLQNNSRVAFSSAAATPPVVVDKHDHQQQTAQTNATRVEAVNNVITATSAVNTETTAVVEQQGNTHQQGISILINQTF
jgi:hypothetical protein